ncbi:hypothetical protein PYCC9005_000908 [Savitreella phatthalungensis]
MTTVQDNLLLEAPLLRLPHELLRSSLKSQQKHVERDSAGLLALADRLSTTADPMELIAGVRARTAALRGKLSAAIDEERACLQACRARLDHMVAVESGMPTAAGGGVLTPDTYSDMREGDPCDHTSSHSAKQRLDRLICDYLLRQGLHETADAYAEKAGVSGLVDRYVFQQSASICAALRNRHRLTEAVAWCGEHKSTLRKQRSTLEFELRKQGLIELMRQGKAEEAIAYCHRHLAPFQQEYAGQIQQICALLCFPPTTTVQPYATLFSDRRWQDLCDLFTQTHRAIYSVPAVSPLEVGLAAGLAALKSPSCFAGTGTDEAEESRKSITSSSSACPICSPELNSLAQHIPAAHSARTHLVDALDGQLMEGDNSPVVLPTGQMYGCRSLELSNADILAATPLTAQSHRGTTSTNAEPTTTDPRTGEVFQTSALRKAYVL